MSLCIGSSGAGIRGNELSIPFIVVPLVRVKDIGFKFQAESRTVLIHQILGAFHFFPNKGRIVRGLEECGKPLATTIQVRPYSRVKYGLALFNHTFLVLFLGHLPVTQFLHAIAQDTTIVATEVFRRLANLRRECVKDTNTTTRNKQVELGATSINIMTDIGSHDDHMLALKC